MDKAEVAEPLPVVEDRYRLLVDAITDYAIYMLDRDGFVTSWNAGAQRFKGYLPSEILGEHFSRFYTEEDRAVDLPARALRIAAEEGRFEREGWRVRKDGRMFWAHIVIDPVWSPSGELVGFAKITRDLTERKKAEESLRRSEEQFRLLVQGVTDYAIYMLDPNGRVNSWNAGAARIKGYTPDEIIGEHFSRFYSEEDRETGAPHNALTTAAAVGRFEKEGWRVRKDGSRFWAHVVIDAIRDDQGEIIGFAKITRDITERMEAQRALEVTREALFQSQKMEAVGQLTGGIAHDFNNLLMAVLGSLELVRKRVTYDPRVTPLIDNAIQGAQRGAVLTQRMLAFARKQELKMEAVDVPALVRGLMNFLDRTIGPNIEVNMRFPGELPRAHTDPYQLEAALMNLAVNARDAMPRGGSITISARPERVGKHPVLTSGDYIRLTVADTGEGMDQATLAKATEPFFTTKGVGKGTGLGLSMVHGLAAQSGGWLTLNSRPGVGTQVELWLPVVTTGLPEAAEREDGGSDVETERRLLILAVDDDSLVLTNTAAMLDDLGHEVIVASSGKEGLEVLRGRPDIDLIISDEVMPNMSGSQFAEAVRSAHPDMPVIITSGYADQEAMAQTRLPRLAKPFGQADLAAIVSEALERAPAA
jgi:PAS domain S-box-containing protein